MSETEIIEYWADWLVDACAMSSQSRMLLRGDPAEDKVITECLFLNAKKAITLALRDIRIKEAVE